MKKFIVCVMSLVLSGCFFSTKNSSFYVLESQQPAEVLNVKMSLAIENIRLPDYLQKPQIVLQKSDSPELKISEFNRWASDLEDMVQNTLIEDLEAIAPKADIKPLAYGIKTRYVIKINIEKMSGYFKEEAVLKGTYYILASSGQLLKQSDFELKTDCGKNYADYVMAQSTLVAQLAEQLIKALPRGV